ncbi:glycerate kinase [Salinisphaera sp. USBA-960]|nr:glycerate kinase [Salifodinibacter halophilus]NNC27117.1 glycerate kinase [Salifodinibacter halophilus]
MSSPRVVLAPDSFKGSLDAPAVANALADGIRSVAPQSDIVRAPMADGGEGTLACVAAACDGRWRSVTMTGIHGRPVTADWYQGVDGTAYIESAAVLGLPLITHTSDAPSIWHRSSAPLGALIRHVLDAGCISLVVALGGSACNDAGLGLLTELGLCAFDTNDKAVADGPADLLRLARIEHCALADWRQDIDVRVLCDVDNPLLGERGATYVFGPQKGLDDTDLASVDTAFARFVDQLGADESSRRPGAGAAGGLGFALATLGATLEPGGDGLLELTGLRDALPEADYVITGEGRTDAQTLAGKTALAIARAADPAPTVLVSGAIDEAVRPRLAAEFSACYSLAEQSGSIDAAQADTAYWLREVGRDWVT